MRRGPRPLVAGTREGLRAALCGPRGATRRLVRPFPWRGLEDREWRARKESTGELSGQEPEPYSAKPINTLTPLHMVRESRGGEGEQTRHTRTPLANWKEVPRSQITHGRLTETFLSPFFFFCRSHKRTFT